MTLLNDSMNLQIDILNIVLIELSEVEEAINKLKSKITTRQEDIPPYIIKVCSDTVNYPLHVIFNRFRNVGKALICPIPKSKTTTDLSNFPPTALLPCSQKYSKTS